MIVSHFPSYVCAFFHNTFWVLKETLVTKGKTLVSEGKTLVTKRKTLVIPGKTLVIKGKNFVTKRMTLVINDSVSQILNQRGLAKLNQLPAGPREKYFLV